MMYLVSWRFEENVKMERLSILILLFLIKLSNAEKEKHLVHSRGLREGSIPAQALMEANGNCFGSSSYPLPVLSLSPFPSPVGCVLWAVGCRLWAVSLHQHVERQSDESRQRVFLSTV